MGKNRYIACRGIIETHFKKGDVVGTITLRSLIMRYIGADERTIECCLRTMIDMKLIKDIGNCHWRVVHNENTKK